MDNGSAITLTSLCKQYPVKPGLSAAQSAEFKKIWALKGVNMSVARGSVTGLIGRNGAGKTTLLAILAGVLEPTSGQCLVSGKVRGLFNLGVGFQDELPGRDNIFLNGAILGAPREELKAKFDAITAFSELGDFVDLPLGTYSQGMRLRLAFSIIANLEFDVLLIDEVLAVGDALFQSKCFERLMDFKRAGRTLVITSQNLDLVERLCDSVALLDHGTLLFSGGPAEAIQRYQRLLATEKFFVGAMPERKKVVECTKKWAEDVGAWGQKTGAHEVIITRVRFLDRFGRQVSHVRSGAKLVVRVSFAAHDTVLEPHFGVAIFRKDGVYCYGTNTEEAELFIPVLKQGEGFFSLTYEHLYLAPGEYQVSVAIWDKKETLAFDYHHGYYELRVAGSFNQKRELVRMPVRNSAGSFLTRRFRNRRREPSFAEFEQAGWGHLAGDDGLAIESIQLLDAGGAPRENFFTGEYARCRIVFAGRHPAARASAWLGIFRDDGICCQGIIADVARRNRVDVVFPALPLLPGGYRLSAGIWSEPEKRFLVFSHGSAAFRMHFNRGDHGTIYIPHRWHWKLPQD